MTDKTISRLEDLTAAQRELLEKLRRKKGLASGSEAVGIRAVLREGKLPLSFAQERLWFLDRLDPLQSTYNQSVAWRLTGDLDIAILAASLTQIVSRHEVLRTTFEEADGEPTQRISPQWPVRLPIFDLSELPSAGGELESARLMTWEAGVPFDLEQGPLMRTAVVRLSSREHVLLCTLHQAVSDPWSIEILGRELATIYTSLSTSLPSPLPPLAIQYADYAIWQRQWLSGERLESVLAYWRRRLAGLGVLELPTDRPRPPMPSLLSGQRSFRLDASLATAIQRASRIEGATPFMVLLAGIQGLLSRWTSQDDVPIGTLVANRTMAELEGMIGRFVNTLTLRGDLSGEPSFREALQRTRELALDAYAHQDVPFELLVEAIRPERDLSRSPLFQVMFTFGSSALPSITFAGLSLMQVSSLHGGSSVDLVFRIENAEECWRGNVEYRLDLFDSPTVDRLVLRFDLLLRGAIAQPDQPISDLSVLPESEVAQLLWEWNDTATARPSLCLHDLFTDQASKKPEATALIWSTQRISYRELDSLSNKLAHSLRDLGVGPEVRVGICLDRSPDLVVSLLGVLKAGGAYVPLDPRYPAERLAFVLSDSESALLITRRNLTDSFLQDGDQRCFYIEDEHNWLASHSASPLAPTCATDNLAYIVYTSGSTGRPKGVAIEHRSATMLVKWASERFSPSELAGVLAATSIAFDLSVFELYAPLALGGTIVLAESILDLPTLPAAAEVTLIDTVPSAVAALLPTGVPSSVRTINMGGEALSRQIVRSIYNLETVKQVFNLYGPSEDTTYSTGEKIDRDEEGPPSIGRPILGKQAYIVDRSLRLLPMGARGELVLGGMGLARGYLERPDLTAERFRPNPFRGEPGARLYRTGDLVRQRPDGRIEFLGRFDHQVKIRGFRIEPGEIEEALRMHPGVRDAAVALREYRNERRLAAFVVPCEASTEPDELRSFLRNRLPDYMVPSSFEVLDALPLTPNGKVDRKVLSALVPLETAHGQRDRPANLLEETLAEIWREVLGLDAISVHAGFFDLGGHSLLATRVVSRLRAALGIDVPLRCLFEHPTVRSLATWIDVLPDSEGNLKTSVQAERPVTTRASFAQERFWYLSELGTDDVSYNVPVSLRLKGVLSVPSLWLAISDITRRHEVLRATFILAKDYLVQRVGAEGRISVPVVDLQGLAHLGSALVDAEVTRLWDQEAQCRFNLSRGPLVRFVVLELAQDEHLLLATFHHIVIDAWSIDIFAQELEEAYRGFSEGRASPVPGLALQYSDFAERQREWLGKDDSKRQLHYWKQELAGAPEVSTFPTDRPRPGVLGSKGARIGKWIDEKVLVRLRTLARHNDATIFTLAVAAMSVLLRRYTSREDLLFGTPVANRSLYELERVIGIFLNTLLLRTYPSRDVSFESHLREVRESFLEALDNQDFPFEKLVEELRPGRTLSYSPLFQILLVHRRSLLGGQSTLIQELQIGSIGAKFDMTFSFVETDGEIAFECEYNRDLFDESTIQRIADHLMAILENITEAPRCPIIDYSFLTRSERHILVSEWNDSNADLIGISVLERFARQALAVSSGLAVVGEYEALTYEELDAHSSRLALRLAARGVGPEVPVAVLIDREPALVIGVLAVLRAGGAYVPLDPEAPQERLAEILKDLGGDEAFILAQDRFADRLPARRLISFDSEYAMAERRSGRRLAIIEPGNLAYIIYTSGTSGRPKGIAVEHRSVAAFLDWAQLYFGPDERRAVLASTSLTFDLSVFELFLPLTTGGCVVLVREPLALLELPRPLPFEVTLINTVPSLMSVILESGALPGSALTVNLAGEALQRYLVNRVFESNASRRLLNLYGPTETTVYATVAAMSQQEKGEPSLGRPIRNAQGYVVNEVLQIQPIGAPGELLLGGEGIARGYWRNPELTAGRFIPNPFSGFGSRLYRTGDLVRWKPDGSLEYLGRLDRQVKIRGLRIEPGDIEAGLLRHPAVKEAVVAAKSSPQGELQLVAYVKLQDGEGEIRALDLRAFLRQFLPRGLVPSSIVLTEGIPRTDRGKVDYKRLPEPDWAGEEAAEFIPPRSQAERYLAEIWTEILGIQHLSINDDFFERGGHSLRAAQVAARLRQAGVALPLRRVLEKPQLGQLAKEIEQLLTEDGVKELVSSSGTDSATWAPTRKETATEPSLLSEDTLTYAEGAEMADLLREILEEKARVLKRRAYVSFPATCTLNAPVALHFQLVAIPPVDPLLLRLARLRVLQPACIETLFVKVVAPAFRVSPHLARMQLPADTDSTLLTFTMIPQELGVHVVEIEVFAGANRVSYFILETEAISYVN